MYSNWKLFLKQQNIIQSQKFKNMKNFSENPQTHDYIDNNSHNTDDSVYMPSKYEQTIDYPKEHSQELPDPYVKDLWGSKWKENEEI